MNTELTIMEEFEIFWKLYGKAVKRFECEHLWCKITPTDRKLIIEYIPKYVESTPDKKFRKDPSTFLFYEGWKDEVIVKSKDPKETPKQYIKPEIKNTMSVFERYLADKEAIEKMQDEYYREIKKNTPITAKSLGLGDMLKQEIDKRLTK